MHPQLIRNRRVILPQKSLLSQRFQKLSVSGWTLARKPTIATSWQTEPAEIVRNPPIRSDTRPQNCRLRKARPSSIESIAAPIDAEIPTSVQRATRWPCGIAIGTQQQKPAAAS